MDSRLSRMAFPAFTYPYRVFYADTDAGGVMYYAQYLRVFEQVRALYIEEFGLSLPELARQNILFVCRRAEIDYLIPAVLGDTLYVKIWISDSTGAALTFSYEITRDREGETVLLATGITKMACCKGVEGRVTPGRIPKWVMERLKGRS